MNIIDSLVVAIGLGGLTAAFYALLIGVWELFVAYRRRDK